VDDTVAVCFHAVYLRPRAEVSLDGFDALTGQTEIDGLAGLVQFVASAAGRVVAGVQVLGRDYGDRTEAAGNIREHGSKRRG